MTTATPFPQFGVRTAPASAQVVVTERVGRLELFLVSGYLMTLGMQFDLFAVGRFAPSDVFLIAYIFLYLFRVRTPRAAWTVFHFGLMPMFAIGTLTAALRWGAVSTYIVINKNVGLLLLLAGYAIFTSFARDWGRIRTVLRIFIHGAVIQSLAAVLAYMAWKLAHISVEWINYQGERVSGMLIDPNAFGGYVGAALAIHVCTYFSPRPLVSGKLGAIYSLVLGMALLLTLSRSAWIGFVFALLITVPFRPKMAVAYVGSIAVVAGTLTLALHDKINGVVALADRRNTAQQRVDQILQALPMIADSPVLGSGLSVFKETHGVLIHNTTVWILTEFGLFGLTIYLGFIGWFFWRGYTSYHRWTAEQPVILGLVGAHACMLGVSAGIEAFYQRHWWLIFAMIAASHALAVKQRRVHSDIV